MCLASMGYVPIWFNSESAKKNQDDMDELRKLADRIYNVPDSDETGTAHTMQILPDGYSCYGYGYL